MNYDELQQETEDNLPIPPRDELWEAIQKGNLTKYTPKQIEKGMLQSDETELLAGNKAIRDRYTRYANNKPYIDPNTLDTNTLYHRAAREGYLPKIPKDLLTAKNLLQTGSKGQTCLHFAPEHGHLAQIPKELLTQENLLNPDWGGNNCLHLAAFYGHLGQIPRELLTAENLLQPNKEEDTCLHFAAMYGKLDQIPRLSYETLTELKAHFETQDCSDYKEKILKTLNDLLEKKMKRLEMIARSQTINHDTDIL